MIGFWKKETGNMLSHGKGLDANQIAFLQNLKEGDRLILWVKNKGSEVAPDFALKLFRPGGQ